VDSYFIAWDIPLSEKLSENRVGYTGFL